MQLGAVDVVLMRHAGGLVVPVANYTLEPITKPDLRLRTEHRVESVSSATQGKINFEQISPGQITLSLPLENNDFLDLRNVK